MTAREDERGKGLLFFSWLRAVSDPREHYILEGTQKRGEVRFFLGGQDQPEAVFIKMHDIPQRPGRAVMEIRCAGSEQAGCGFRGSRQCAHRLGRVL